jgi:hypothetical protein
MSEPTEDVFPKADVDGPRKALLFGESRLAWAIVISSCVTAAIIVIWAVAGSGSRIRIRFREGHGLKPRDPVKYRGIVVGEVESVELAPDLSALTVTARLLLHADRLARAGTRFWIERPRFALGKIRSPGTLVGGRYLAASPGPEEAPPSAEFVGVEAPPESVHDDGRGLEVILECNERLGLESGSRVTYRGIAVGKVMSVGLSSDAVRVEARVHIASEYRALVRTNTCFWRTSGIGMSWGLFTGVQMDVDSLSAITSGGVSLATPDEPADAVTTGRRFVLHKHHKEEWLTWAPQIALGSPLLPDGAPRPHPSRVSLSWREKAFIGSRAKQVNGWALLVEGDVLLGPSDLLVAPGDGVEGDASLAWRGAVRRLTGARSTMHGRLALLDVTDAGAGEALAWPAKRTRRPTATEDCAVFADPRSNARALSVGRLKAREEAWEVDESVPFDEDWHGAAVLSRRDGRLIGILLVRDQGGALIAMLPAFDSKGDDRTPPAE